jgi:DNA-binding LacI/PurR family transcriptional regulator
MSSPTIIDVARVAGVSIKTVSRVINQGPGVSANPRKVVQSAIAKLDYRPNVWARSLRSARTYTIALLSSYTDLNQPIYYLQQNESGTHHQHAADRFRQFYHPVRIGSRRTAAFRIVAPDRHIGGKRRYGHRRHGPAYRHDVVLPEKLSVVGIDGNPMGETFWPPPTTMSQPLFRLTQRAAQILIELIAPPEIDKRKIFEFNVVVRGSATTS